MREIFRVFIGGVSGAGAGLLTRPCCVVPVVLSVTGLGSTGLAQAAVTHRAGFLSLSAVMLGVSLWMTFRRDGGWVAKIVVAGAAVMAFGLSVAFTGVL